MTDTPKTALELQIEAERKELENVPKQPIGQFMGSHRRCHICGQIHSEHDLRPYDQHTGTIRMGCPSCDPNRGR